MSFFGELQEFILIQMTGKHPAIGHDFFLAKSPALRPYIRLKEFLNLQRSAFGFQASHCNLAGATTFPLVFVSWFWVRLDFTAGAHRRFRNRGLFSRLLSKGKVSTGAIRRKRLKAPKQKHEGVRKLVMSNPAKNSAIQARWFSSSAVPLQHGFYRFGRIAREWAPHLTVLETYPILRIRIAGRILTRLASSES